MNLFSVFQQFPDQAACISHLEAVRWGEEPQCPFCTSLRVAPKAERELVGRWNCHACKSSFNVLSGTVFEKTQGDDTPERHAQEFANADARGKFFRKCADYVGRLNERFS